MASAYGKCQFVADTTWKHSVNLQMTNSSLSRESYLLPGSTGSFLNFKEYSIQTIAKGTHFTLL